MRFLPVNSDSFLIELASLDETLALFDTLRQAALPGVDELVPAARTVLVHFSPWLTSARALIAAIAALPVAAGTGRSVPQISVAVRYDGEDLPALAERLGVSAAELIEAHQSLRWKVAFTGFAPGFAYMVSPGWDYEVPRRTTPRTRIPAGSLGLAGEFSGIYPQAADRHHRYADVGYRPPPAGATAAGRGGALRGRRRREDRLPAPGRSADAGSRRGADDRLPGPADNLAGRRAPGAG